MWLGIPRASRGWWVLFWSLIVWQFLVTGFRTANWWNKSGAGKDALLIFALVSGLAMIGRDDNYRNALWKSVYVAGSVGVLLSLFAFYSETEMNEERFRICWRGRPGFDAVTTGIFVGMALMIGLIGLGDSRWWNAFVCAALAWLGFGLAASESRGALLAVIAGISWWLLKNYRRWSKLVWPLFGFATYWILVAFWGQGRSGLVERGSSGRIDIYLSYLSQIKGSDWIIGKGHIWMLPESVLGWLVHHPHNAYLGQLAGYGIIGLVLMLATLSWGFNKLHKSKESAILIFGLVTLLFDGGMVFSMFSTARWEALVVMIPLVLGVAAEGARRDKPLPQA